MSRRSLALLGLTPLLLLGCTGPAERLPLAQEARVSATAGVLRDVTVDEASIDHSSGTPTAQVTVTNERAGTIRLSYEFYWYDDSGNSVGRSTSRRSVALRAGEMTVLREAAPNTRATDFRIQLFR